MRHAARAPPPPHFVYRRFGACDCCSCWRPANDKMSLCKFIVEISEGFSLFLIVRCGCSAFGDSCFKTMPQLINNAVKNKRNIEKYIKYGNITWSRSLPRSEHKHRVFAELRCRIFLPDPRYRKSCLLC